MKWLLYNLLFAIAYLAMTPAFLLRMKRRGGYRARMGDRFGRYPASLEIPENAVWIHAVSVGEVAVAGQLMRALREARPDLRFVFSTTSSTGWRQAQSVVTERDALIYNPLDFNGCVERALDRIRPRAVIVTETEIWPNFLRALKRRGVPAFLVNARISDRSAPRYRKLRWFFGEVLRCFTKIYAQSDMDSRRLAAAGADPAAIEVTGSFKFDVARRNEAKEQEIREWIGGGELIVGGSTWPGEDRAMLRIYAKVLEQHPETKLAIVPRHFEKADEVEANIRAAGFECVRRSRGERAAATGRAVWLGDTTGEMMGFWGIASVAFVGKSLCAHGSQNMIEPCLCGVPTIVGPYTENFRPVMSDLLAAGAVCQVPDESALEAKVLEFMAAAALRKSFGENASAAVKRRRGVVARCAADIIAAAAL